MEAVEYHQLSPQLSVAHLREIYEYRHEFVFFIFGNLRFFYNIFWFGFNLGDDAITIGKTT